MHFLLLYDFTEDYLQRRAPYRREHLRLAWEAHERGELILGGALADSPAGAVVLFQGADDRAARAFIAADPYVTAGVVD
ncbi:MAG TPA: YciI family protein [Steroidobacteraceae bacterium]